MFAISGKLYDWETKDVNGKNLLTITLFKKNKEKESKYIFNTFSDKINSLFQNKTFCGGDSVEIKFFIKCKERNNRWFTDLYVEDILLLKKGKNSSLNIFEGRSNFVQGE